MKKDNHIVEYCTLCERECDEIARNAPITITGCFHRIFAVKLIIMEEGRTSMRHENLSEILDERKGLLLIDGVYNTLLIPFGSNEMEELVVDFIRKNLKYVRKNKSKSDLNNSIKEYLNMKYENKARDDS